MDYCLHHGSDLGFVGAYLHTNGGLSENGEQNGDYMFNKFSLLVIANERISLLLFM